MLRSDSCDYSDVYILLLEEKLLLVLQIEPIILEIKKPRPLAFKIMHHLFLAFQK